MSSSTSPLAMLAVFAGVGIAILVAMAFWMRPEPRTLAIWVVSLVGGLGISGALLFKIHRDQQHVERLTREGLGGMATIISANGTGVLVNRVPQLRLKLRVELAGKPPYDIEQVLGVPLGQSATPGRVVPVKVHPSDPQQMLLDWGSAPATVPAAGPDVAARLKKLDALRAQKLISAEEYEQQRARLLSEL